MAFAHVLGGAAVERDCNICDQTFIENDVMIGDRVIIKDGVCDVAPIGANATIRGGDQRRVQGT